MLRLEGQIACGVCAWLAAGCSEPGSEAPSAGARATLLWDGQQELFASDSAELDQFGYSVALSAGRAIVGAIGDASFRGAAYVFVQADGVWKQEQKLVATDGVAGDNFGCAVALSGDRALVGAYGAGGYRGAAYVFTNSGGVWTEEHKLVDSDSAEFDQLGYSVAIDAGRALAGAYGHDGGRGAAYVFSSESGSWDAGQKLLAGDGVAEDDFGFAVALAGPRALVGAPGGDRYRGAVYSFTSDGTTWSEDQKLITTDGTESDQFGNSVALSGETALVGAFWNANLRGAAHIFSRSGGTWKEEQSLVASDGDVGHRFGSSVSLDGDRALVGAWAYGKEAGAAYVFVRAEGSWNEERKLLASDGGAGDLFAWSVAIADGRALLGANYADQVRGKAYAYALGERPPPPDTPEPAAEPATCSSGSDCESRYCEDGICCDRSCSASERCRAELKVSGEDGACGPSVEAVLGASCQFDVQCTSGRCVEGLCRETIPEQDPPQMPAARPVKSAGCGYSGVRLGSYDFCTLLIAGAAVSMGRRRIRSGPSRDRSRPRRSVVNRSCR